MSFSYISKYEQTRLWKYSSKNKPLNHKDSVQELYMLKKYLYGSYNPRRRIPLQNCLTSEGRSKLACIMPNARDNGCLQTAGRSEHAMRIPVVKNTHINPTPKRVAFTSAEVKPWKCRICLGGYYGTTFGVHFLGAIVTTGRFVAFAPHVTRGFYKGNTFGVFNTD